MGARVRKGVNLVATLLTALTLLIVLVPLLSILVTAVQRGGSAVTSPGFFTESPANPCSPRAGTVCHFGGIAPALDGTLALVGLAALLSVPIGLAAAIFVVEYGRDRPVARLISASADVLSGVPSIVAGLFIYTYLAANDPQIVYSALSGSLALSILMIPIVTRTAEEALRTVPNSQREAARALGITQWKATVRITLAAALPGIVTGVLLAVARAAGEAAPLLLTAFGNNLGFQGFTQPSDAIPLLVYDFATSPYQNWIALAWGAALTLIVIVLGLSILSRLVLARMARRLRGGG